MHTRRLLPCIFFFAACSAASAPPAGSLKQADTSGTTVSSEAPSYPAGSPVTIDWAGMSGDPNDWIAIAQAGSPDTSYEQFVFTYSGLQGTTVFNNIGAGTWVARAFFSNTYVKQAESAPFTIASAGAASVASEAGAYDSGASVTIDYAGMSGSQLDWIAIGKAGSPDGAIVQYAYTGGALAGSLAFAGLADGSYVARAFFDNGYDKQAESAPFTVGPQAAAGPLAVSTDAAAYVSGGAVSVRYSGLPGNQLDWISIAQAGSPDSAYVQYAFTGGAPSGTAMFTGLPDGQYVARAYFDNTYVKQAESAVFRVGTIVVALSTDQPTYNPGDDVIVSFGSMPGNALDWIAIAPNPSPDAAYSQYQYTGGATSGSLTFSGLPVGKYFARAYFDNGFTKQGEVAFQVGASATATGPATVATDAASYASGGGVTVSYTNASGDPTDWIAIAQAGAPDASFTQYVYLGGQVNGSASFSGLADGSYVARIFFANSYTKQAETAPFTVGASAQAANASVSTDKPSYATTDAVTVSFAGMSGSAVDWIAVAQAGSADDVFVQYQYTGGNQTGTLSFSGLAAGSYVARAYFNNSFTRQAESAAFTVAEPSSAASLSTDAAQYASGAPVVVTFSGMLGASNDWIAIATAGSADDAYLAYQYTGGGAAGTLTFDGLPDGSYVARAFFNNGFTKQGETAPFTVGAQPPADGGAGD